MLRVRRGERSCSVPLVITFSLAILVSSGSGFCFQHPKSSIAKTYMIEQHLNFIYKIRTVVEKKNRRQSSSPVLLSLRANKNPSGGNHEVAPYNDDAFGLVCLGSALAIKDVEFAGTFLILSAIAAAMTNTGIWKSGSDPRVPAAISIFALLLRPFVACFVTRGTSVLEAPPILDAGLVAASTVWASINYWQKAR